MGICRRDAIFTWYHGVLSRSCFFSSFFLRGCLANYCTNEVRCVGLLCIMASFTGSYGWRFWCCGTVWAWMIWNIYYGYGWADGSSLFFSTAYYTRGFCNCLLAFFVSSRVRTMKGLGLGQMRFMDICVWDGLDGCGGGEQAIHS